EKTAAFTPLHCSRLGIRSEKPKACRHSASEAPASTMACCASLGLWLDQDRLALSQILLDNLFAGQRDGSSLALSFEELIVHQADVQVGIPHLPDLAGLQRYGGDSDLLLHGSLTSKSRGYSNADGVANLGHEWPAPLDHIV